MDGTRANRTLLRTLVWAVLLAFAPSYRFLATVTTVALSLVTGVLLAVALSGSVKVLHRYKVPRPLTLAVIVAGIPVRLLPARGTLGRRRLGPAAGVGVRGSLPEG